MAVNDSVLRMRAMPKASTLTRGDESSCATEAAALFPLVLRAVRSMEQQLRHTKRDINKKSHIMDGCEAL